MDDVTENLFQLFCSTMAPNFENVCEIIANFKKQVKA